MGRKKMEEDQSGDGYLIGIRLLPDSYVPLCLNTHQLNNGKIIGTVYIPIEGTTCAYLRRQISMFLVAPKDFCFLNSAGWPFDVSLEEKIQIRDCMISSVVTIQKKHGKFSRIGIKLLNGQILGFIFLNIKYEISYVRNLITSEFSDQFESNETFEFIENNFWPVRISQENSLSLWDIVVNNCISIKKKLKRSIEYTEEKFNKRLKLHKASNLEIMNKEEELKYPSILISYVHAEASTYARNLKSELLKIGFKNIFLDVDDISAGQDWQDVISIAVNKCSIFIPLVTPRYGETRWTNREAKLADDREKIIIPISFLDKWPPDQLAIQFVTLQYIPWKSPDEINGGSFSGYSDSVWNLKSVQRVAKQIKKLCSDPEVSTPDSVSLLDGKVKPDPFTMKLSETQRNRLNDNEKGFIVISAHSKQNIFVKKVSKMLEKDGFSVWTSMNMCECDENTFSPIEDSNPLFNSPFVETSGMASITLGDEKGTMEHSSSTVKRLKSDFKNKVKEAKLVVLIFSEEYLKSRICKQQLFYCEQRKKAIVIKHGDFPIEHQSMILNLYPEREMISSENWECLKFKIKDKLKFDTEDSYKSTITLSVSQLRNVVDTEQTVYVFGGTDRISTNAKAFCLALGTELAKVKKLKLATEGFYGAGDLVGRNFCEEQEIRNKGKPPNVYHVIPTKDTSDYSHKVKQSSDGSFEKLPYGNTLYYGMSVSNRDDIVAAAFKLCILIEGGERSACLAEKFLWNDCTVIPVLYNNNAIKYKNCLKESITKVPNGVNANDWENLNLPDCSTEERVASVKKIVCALLNLSS